MRGVAVLLGYLLGIGAMVSLGLIGLTALQSSTTPTPPAPVAAKERLAKPVKQTAVAQKDPHANQKRKTVHATRKRTEDAPTFAASGFNAYGYAQEPRRAYGYPSAFFGR